MNMLHRYILFVAVYQSSLVSLKERSTQAIDPTICSSSSLNSLLKCLESSNTTAAHPFHQNRLLAVSGQQRILQAFNKEVIFFLLKYIC